MYLPVRTGKRVEEEKSTAGELGAFIFLCNEERILIFFIQTGNVNWWKINGFLFAGDGRKKKVEREGQGGERERVWLFILFFLASLYISG